MGLLLLLILIVYLGDSLLVLKYNVECGFLFYCGSTTFTLLLYFVWKQKSIENIQ